MSEPGPVVNFGGELVVLGPARRDLLPLYLRWANDFEVTRTTGASARIMTLEAEQAWLDRMSGDGEHDVLFTIYLRDGQRPIGMTGLHGIDTRNRNAEFGIMIGEKDCWGRGYGTEATSLALDYGFSVLGLHNIMLRVFASHQRAIRAYARAGFKEVGRRRQARWLAGQFEDVVWMDCLASEFESPVLRALLRPTERA